MNPRIIRLREELAKNKEKITTLQARNRELEKAVRELENTDIIGMVRAQGMTLEQFVLAYIKTEFLCAGQRKYVSRNYHYEAMGRKEGEDFD